MRYLTDREFNRQMQSIKRRNSQIEMRRALADERSKGKLIKLGGMKTSNKVLAASVVAIILFTIACLHIQYRTSVEVSSTLITLWFSFWTVEIVSLAGIKITKVIKDYNSTETGSSDLDSDDNYVG